MNDLKPCQGWQCSEAGRCLCSCGKHETLNSGVWWVWNFGRHDDDCTIHLGGSIEDAPPQQKAAQRGATPRPLASNRHE